MIEQSIKKKHLLQWLRKNKSGGKSMCSKSVPSVPMFQSVFGKSERSGGLRKRGVNFEIGTEHGTALHKISNIDMYELYKDQ